MILGPPHDAGDQFFILRIIIILPEISGQFLKKICAILLFSLFLFNLWGYYLLFISLRYRADRQLEIRLDAGKYNSRETIVLKTFLPLPYAHDGKDFERAQGEMVYQGLHYNVVKRRLFRDT